MSTIATLVGSGLCVDFQRFGDRIQHTISVVEGCHLAPILKSIEGSSDESWPVSPAFQELHLEQRGPSLELALLVGMAGTSHWSASIALDRTAKTLHFDIACRIKTAPAQLGSAYEIFAESVVSQNETLQLASIHGGIRIRAAQASIQHQGKRLSVAPLLPLTPVVPGTVRWQYFIN